MQSHKLSRSLSQKSVYQDKYSPKSSGIRHIILTGHINYNVVNNFLEEFFNQSWTRSKYVFVLLSDQKPDRKLMNFVNFEEDNFVQFYQGSVLDEIDLERVQTSTATACIIFTNHNSTNPVQEDQKTFLYAMSVKKYNPTLELYVQTLIPSNKDNLKELGVEHVISSTEIRYSILGFNCLFPGGSTFIGDLLETHQSNPLLKEEWEHQYMESKANEIYYLNLPSVFHNMLFTDIVRIIYTKWHSLPFAVRVHNSEGNDRLVLYPHNYRVLPQDLIYIISTDIKVINNIEKCRDLPGDSHYFEHPKNVIQFDDTILLESDEYLDIEQHNEGVIEANYSPSTFYYNTNTEKLSDYIVRSICDNDQVTNHIIICTEQLLGLDHFIKPLRNRFLEKIQQIVILVDQLHLVKTDWMDSKMFSQLYIIKGSMNSHQDLIRAGIHKASKIILLQNKIKKEQLSDIENILAYTSITKEYDIHATVELMRSSNMRFLSKIDRFTSKSSYKKSSLSELYAAGKIVYQSFLDGLTSLIFFNPDILRVLRHLIDWNANDNYTLIRISVPEHMISGDNYYFSDVLDRFMEREILPLAIYRSESVRGNSEPYVITCPPPDTPVIEGDFVFVLAPKRDITDIISMELSGNLLEEFEEVVQDENEGIITLEERLALQEKHIMELHQKLDDIMNIITYTREENFTIF
eukprot:TRINITY_DN5244_c0_g1_i5.p1 TRINITY_DN5244_c0_g1~~TRINITY_DN5244_c0_g1_i5.p1  ORF type:complete len:690 (-),score=118.15 TRINITY_DN5244_c0_g1_i5:31-2100(-)